MQGVSLEKELTINLEGNTFALYGMDDLTLCLFNILLGRINITSR